MDLLILPGNSPGNKPWAKQVTDSFSTGFDKVIAIEYESWITNDFKKIVDLDVEMKKVAKVVSSMSDYCVFAKSVGTALCTKAVAHKVIKPQKCVFVGIPLDWLAENSIHIENWVSEYHIPTMVIQQKNDPFGDWEENLKLLSINLRVCWGKRLLKEHQFKKLKLLGVDISFGNLCYKMFQHRPIEPTVFDIMGLCRELHKVL